MSLSEYAEQQIRLGTKVLFHNGIYWRKVRPFFYRPLLPVEGYVASTIDAPVGWPSGFQYALADGVGQQANSTMNFIMLDELHSYSLESLNHKRRQLIKRAAQQFQVRPLQNSMELKTQGHRVYLSFYHRTRYTYKQDRLRHDMFGDWIDTLFSSPKTILIGGYGPNGLAAVSSSYWVNHTLVYSTLICESEAMHRNLGELMFHEIRMLAARNSGIREIYVRNYHGCNSLDQYYIYRGCRLVRKPARLEIPPTIQTMIRCIMPHKYRLLLGED